MAVNGGTRDSRVRTLGLTAVVLVGVGVVLMLLGPATDYGTAVFGALLLGLGVIGGVAAVAINAFRR